MKKYIVFSIRAKTHIMNEFAKVNFFEVSGKRETNILPIKKDFAL